MVTIYPSTLRQILALLMLMLGSSMQMMPCANATDASLLKQHAPETYLADRHHRDIEVMTVGDGPARAYVFIPQNPPVWKAPVVFFHHGWLGMNPINFGGLLDLLTRRGAIVIYPVYQDGNKTPPQRVTDIAGWSDAAALAMLQMKHPGIVDTTKVFYAGYSMGATISLNLAIDPDRFGLPAPEALLMIAPGDARHVARGPLAESIIGPVESLPPELPVVVVSGLSDTSIGVPTSRLVAKRMCDLDVQRRVLILLPSDSENGVRIQAGHGSPGAPDSRYNFPDSRGAVSASIPWHSGFEQSASLNVLDYYGYWRIVTRLADWVAGRSSYPEEIFRNSAENRFLGQWPDGRPYSQAIVEDPCPH